MTNTVTAKKRPKMTNAGIAAAIGVSTVLSGCATVKLEAPDKPIEINLNINITQELRVKLDKDIESLVTDNPDLF